MTSVLIIDDSSIWLKLATKQLEDSGFRVHTATTCTEAILQAKRHRPDCILMDFHLPAGDARTLCPSIRATLQPDAPVIVVFSGDMEMELTAYGDCHAKKFILKGPGTLKRLPFIISDILNLQQPERT